MTFPNLVIAGAPKCGTSSLFNWLVDHPDVCGSSVKEPFFLMDEDNPLRRRDCNFHDHGLGAYARYFERCGDAHKVIVEATTHYIYQATALEVLASLPTRPRLLFALRKPSERIYSSFAYSKNNLGAVKGDLSFAEFVDLTRNSPDIPALEGVRGPSEYVLARDIRYSRYVDYLSKWRERIGPDRMRILLFEDIRDDTRAVMADLCRWLGIDPAFYAGYDFEARNRTVAVRSRLAQMLARALAARAPAGPVKNAVKRLYLAAQLRRGGQGRTPADEAAIAKLDEDFRPSNQKLAREFGVNLEPWGE